MKAARVGITLSSLLWAISPGHLAEVSRGPRGPGAGDAREAPQG